MNNIYDVAKEILRTFPKDRHACGQELCCLCYMVNGWYMARSAEIGERNIKLFAEQPVPRGKIVYYPDFQPAVCDGVPLKQYHPKIGYSDISESELSGEPLPELAMQIIPFVISTMYRKAKCESEFFATVYSTVAEMFPVKQAREHNIKELPDDITLDYFKLLVKYEIFAMRKEEERRREMESERSIF